MKAKFAAFSVLLVAVLASSVSAGNVHCPENCVPALAGVCDTVEGILEKVPVVEKRVPFVLEIVGRAICFPEEPKPVKGSLCPGKCGKEGVVGDTFTRVCNYVDDILQATGGVPTKIRNLTDHAICAIADLFPDSEEELLLLAQVNKKNVNHDSRCPANCMPKLAELCDEVLGILENVPVVGKLPEVVDLVGKAICFPSDTKANPGSLCPESCGKDGDKESHDIFTKICHYTDNILQSTPGVAKKIRNITDIAICTIGKLIPDAKELEITVASENFKNKQFCPDNCDEKLLKICEFVEELIRDNQQMSALVDQEIGRAICFPADAKPHEGSMCPEDCGEAEAAKVCQYVDLLMQVPQVPDFMREFTTNMICKLSKHFKEEYFTNLKHGSAYLRK